MDRHLKPAEVVTYDENTLFKVYDSLRIVGGISEELARDTITDMQNKGILFRERAHEIKPAGPVCR
jgi:hypothetical protein